MKTKTIAILVVGAVCLSVFSSIGQTIYEAEDATLSGPAAASSNGGYTGTGYADYANNNNDYVEFALNANSAGSYPITFRYANGGTTDRPLQLSVNGVTVAASLSFPPTGGWTAWLYTATNSATFNAGLNKVRITATGSSGANVDHMLVTVNGTSAPAPVTNNILSAPFRRAISPNQPMWLVHIDTWNYADPQKIIDLIPADIRPYVVMNISLSISHDSSNRFDIVEYGYETAKSWIRTCAQNQMWCMVQPSSGGFSHLSDFDLSVYEEFFRDYPNFLGFNYTEQFWGYDSTTDPLSAKWVDRINHFADLLPLCSKYGGYLVVGWCGNQYDPNINPIAMLKRNARFAAACKTYAKNYILEEKYTQQGYQSDMESLCLGAYLSGYSGNYGIRYDETGWTDGTGTHTNFTMASAMAVHLEHMLMGGATVVDAPELVWAEDFRELSAGATDNGYTMRRWSTFPQFDNDMVDVFRKIIDGTVRIPSRQEVINRTKFVVIDDINSGSIDNQYSSPQDLFDGLYKMDNDGYYANNKTLWKKTGRYPTIPVVYQLNDALAQSFQVKINRSAYSTRWPTISAKTNEFNTQFASEYTGDLYARRLDNTWVLYNPYKLIGVTASGSIPFQYNTCDHVGLTCSEYTAGVMNETSNKVTFYLANYDSQVNTALKTDTIAIYGATSQPTFSWADRGSHQASVVSSSWSGGVFMLTVQHNGSLDITVNCAGAGTGRLTAFTPATLVPPAKPLLYPGPRQHEGECFDYKNIAGVTKNGYSGTLRNYTGQGYINFGTSSTAAVRKSVSVLKSGTYRLQTK
ncbi:MAG TPA: glycoside hydrolase family 98 domain-containing protein, partial [Candidatus Angelobacter sp.]|nr:glycoside hydrolase family 98 domain-containing protein [Candidatus Angelobacter sp.]